MDGSEYPSKSEATQGVHGKRGCSLRHGYTETLRNLASVECADSPPLTIGPSKPNVNNVNNLYEPLTLDYCEP